MLAPGLGQFIAPSVDTDHDNFVRDIGRRVIFHALLRQLDYTILPGPLHHPSNCCSALCSASISVALPRITHFHMKFTLLVKRYFQLSSQTQIDARFPCAVKQVYLILLYTANSLKSIMCD
jgi:hypothetical protein